MAQGDVADRRAQHRLVALPAGEHLQLGRIRKHLVIGDSRSSLPCSTSCITQAPVIALVIDAMLQTVSSVIATPLPISRSPKAAS